jgi:hypothetical protein
MGEAYHGVIPSSLHNLTTRAPAPPDGSVSALSRPQLSHSELFDRRLEHLLESSPAPSGCLPE